MPWPPPGSSGQKTRIRSPQTHSSSLQPSPWPERRPSRWPHDRIQLAATAQTHCFSGIWHKRCITSAARLNAPIAPTRLCRSCLFAGPLETPFWSVTGFNCNPSCISTTPLIPCTCQPTSYYSRRNQTHPAVGWLQLDQRVHHFSGLSHFLFGAPVTVFEPFHQLRSTFMQRNQARVGQCRMRSIGSSCFEREMSLSGVLGGSEVSQPLPLRR